MQHKTKSRTFLRKKVRTINGTVTRYIKKSPSRATCSVTGQKLHGVVRGSPNQVAKVPRSSRRPERPFGGVLSSKASRAVLKSRARKD